MIAYLQGSIQKKIHNSIILNVKGVGYLVNVNQNILNECEEEDNMELFCHTAVKEDDISIYGFAALEELQMFKLLISVSGVGPKSALEILNNPISSLKYAISNSEITLLVNTPGIGKKTAERIIVDLKSKIDVTDKPDDYKVPQEIDDDALLALINLGYRKQQVVQTIKKKPEDIKKTEDIIRYFLQNAS